MIGSNDAKKFDLVDAVDKQNQNVIDKFLTEKQNANLGKDSQSWEGRKVSCLSGAWEELCKVIKYIFDQFTAIFFCTSSEEQAVSDNDSDISQVVINQLEDKKNDFIVQYNAEKNKISVQVKIAEQKKADNEFVDNKILETSDDDSEGRYEICSDSTSEEDEGIDQNANPIQKSALNELPKVSTSVPSGTASVTFLSVNNKSSSKVNDVAKIILDEKKINRSNIFIDQNNLISQKPPISSKSEEKEKKQEKFLDEILNDFDFDYDYEDDELQDHPFKNPLDHEQDVGETDEVNLDDYYYVSEEEIIEKKIVFPKVETKTQPSRFLSNVDSPDTISKKSVRPNSVISVKAKPEDVVVKSLQTLKKSLKDACTNIDKGETPEYCVRCFYVSLEKEAGELTSGEKLELICMLINKPNEINEEIEKAVEQSSWKDPRAKVSFDKSWIYTGRTMEEKMQELAQISAEKREQSNKKRIESLKANFFGTEFSIFISGQVFAREYKSVQQIVGCLQDCGKYKIDKQAEILSLIMTTLYYQLVKTIDVQDLPYSFATLQSYIFMLEDLNDVVFGSIIQKEPLQIDYLAIDSEYSDDESDEETVISSNSIQINPGMRYGNSHNGEQVGKAELEFQAKLSSLAHEAQAKLDYEQHKAAEKLKMEFNVSKNYHESAMNLLKAHAAIQRLTEFNFSKFNQNLFKTMLEDIVGLISNINPSCEKYLKLQELCRECFGAYILKDFKISSLDSIEKLYSQIANKLDLLSFKDFRQLLDSKAFAKQLQALQHLKEFAVDKNDIKLFVALVKELAGSLGDVNPSHPLYSKLCVAFNKIPDLYVNNYKELQKPDLKEIVDCYDSLAKKFGHKTSQDLERSLNLQSDDSKKKYKVLALLKELSLVVELTIFEEKLIQTESSIGEITDSHFLYKPLENAFAAILNKYMEILMTCNPMARDPDTMKKIKTAYDSLAKKLNLPCCPDSELLLSADFADKYVGLQRLQEYSEIKMEVESFVELLTDASNFIKNIDSKHPLFMPLTNAFDAIIQRYYNYSGNSLELAKMKAPYSRLAQILGYKEVDLVVDTKEAEKEDSGMSNYANVEYLIDQREDVVEKLNSLKFEYDLTDTRAMAMVWRGYLENLLLDKLPRETAIGMLLVTFQKELKISGLPKVWDKDMDLEGYLNAFSRVGKMQIQMIRENSGMFLNTFVKAGLSEVEADELLFEIIS